MALAELWKLKNWVQMVFSNLYSRLQDLSNQKKENFGKDTKFDATQVLDIILQH
jgi:hypothetical protein